MWKFCKMGLGIALLPACWAVSRAVYALWGSTAAGAATGWEAWALPVGFLLQAALFLALPRATRTYVLGHELTHALWALLMGGRVGRMKVGKEGGHVELSKTNFVITLAPYFFPFYTVLVVAGYYLAGLVWAMAPYRTWWLGAVGFTWSFHLVFTLHMLSQRQPDVQEHGWIFSHVVIYLMNAVVIGLWMALVGAPRLAELGAVLVDEATAAYQWVWNGLLTAWTWGARPISGSGMGC